MNYKFQIENAGKTYSCERKVTGKRILKQSIYVIGKGRKDDFARYGKGCHSVSTMESIARLIALEIIK